MQQTSYQFKYGFYTSRSFVLNKIEQNILFNQNKWITFNT